MSSRLQRSSISPFRSRKTPSAPAPKPVARPTTPSTGSIRPTTPSHSSASRPTTVSGTTSSSSHPATDRPEFHKSKENVTVTVRFRPLSPREIGKGDEIAWYADGDSTVRSECNPSIAYGFDRVFGPATTTRHVYDVAAQHVVSGAMQGINGTVFAYGVTSSGKTHTMHGEQKSPGIIPLAVKDVFSIIQETPGREFLLRVSYLEIYNEVINDLLDPAGQNLRIREDSQGTYVEGIKEEVVLSPAHALSLIASGEEHRHVGSNNFNLLSSRSHTIFTLTIESSPDENNGDEDVTLSQLNLIDLAGSESSKAETTGLRRKEGSYINKSLLSLGTVISKLTDDKATHIPYRDSKLTRLLQSSLSGHGRISLICTVTPASSNSEETHNTLKFAHRSKYVEIKASQNKIMDEKSLIKKYQREISCLKEELQRLKCGMMEKHSSYGQEDIANLKLQLEAGQVKLLSRLEEEEDAKAALMGRIQRLTKLILVSTKNSLPSIVTDKGGHRRRHSFGEDELAYLPDRKREYAIDDDAGSIDSELSREGRFGINGLDETQKFDKKNRKRGMLGWFKLKKHEYLHGLSPNADYESSASGCPLEVSEQKIIFSDMTDAGRNSVSRKGDDISLLNYFPEKTQAGALFSATAKGLHPPPTGTTIMDEMDLLSEQVKMLAGEVALCTSSLKRLAEQASKNPEDSNIQEQMQKLRDEINEKKLLLHVLEQKMIGSLDDSPHSSNSIKLSQSLSKLATQLSEKTFELEIMSADNRILQDQLQMKISDNANLQETIKTLNDQLNYFIGKIKENGHNICSNTLVDPSLEKEAEGISLLMESSSMELFSIPTNEESKGSNSELSLKSQVLTQAAEIENLKQNSLRLAEEKDGLQIHCQKLAEEASYARELAATAAVELRNLAEEVTKLSYVNAKLTEDLAASRETATGGVNNSQRQVLLDENDTDDYFKKSDDSVLVEELRKDLLRRRERESSLEAALSVRDQRECELKKSIDESKQREQDLENELTSMLVLVAKLKKSSMVSDGSLSEWFGEPEYHPLRKGSSIINGGSEVRFKGERFSDFLYEDHVASYEEIRSAFEYEKRRCRELEGIISKLKGEDLGGLDVKALEEMQNCHVEALSKICQEKLKNRTLMNQEDETAN